MYERISFSHTSQHKQLYSPLITLLLSTLLSSVAYAETTATGSASEETSETNVAESSNNGETKITVTCQGNCEGLSVTTNVRGKEEEVNEESAGEDGVYGAKYIQQAGRVGLGLSGGLSAYPLSLKVYGSENFAFELTGPFFFPLWLFMTFGGDATFLYESSPFFEGSVADIGWYAGGGLSIMSSLLDPRHEILFLLHANVGIKFLFKGAPVDITIGYKPIMPLPPVLDLLALGALNFNIGVRYYF